MREILLSHIPSQPEIDRLVEFARNHGGIDYAFGVMERMRREAMEMLDEYPDRLPISSISSLTAITDPASGSEASALLAVVALGDVGRAFLGFVEDAAHVFADDAYGKQLAAA